MKTKKGCDTVDLTFYSDGKGRHLVCVPYTVENLHRMAETLGIKRCWFHNTPSGPHYDIPKKRIVEITGKTTVVSTKTILTIVKGKYVKHNEKDEGLCPICGEHVTLIGETTDGRLIGSCRDAFTKERWEEDDESREKEG